VMAVSGTDRFSWSHGRKNTLFPGYGRKKKKPEKDGFFYKQSGESFVITRSTC
jgi:hypothetical protein